MLLDAVQAKSQGVSITPAEVQDIVRQIEAFSPVLNAVASVIPGAAPWVLVGMAFVGAVSSALTITTAPHLSTSAFSTRGTLASALTGLSSLSFLGLVIVGGTRRRKGIWQFAAMLLIVLVIGVAGCGGGGHTPVINPTTGTPAGSYTVTATATSGGTSHTGTITLVVQ